MNHRPTFSYSTPVAGNIYNWGYGPAFSVNTNSTPITSAPSMTWDDKTVYLKGWHIHSPADHSVQGDRSKSELHLVHSDAEGHEKAVVAIRVDPGNTNSPFFNQFEQPSNSSTITTMPNFDETTTIPTTLDMAQVLSEVANFSEFWTYEGSLTSPPCTEGIRWFVARNVLFVGVDQMREVLRVSTYSARVEQEVWQHEINV
ncbi:alpha carbonic anhydrase [Halenospora varia]|nr:alpha carbonic anhydrase [Halenospora varia]